MSSNSYAMFSSSMQGNQSMSEIQKSQELRRRPGTGTEDSSSINQNINPNPNSNSRAPIKAGDLYRVYSGGSSNGYSDNSGHAQGGSSQYMQMQLQQQQRPDRDYVSRVKGAEKVEKAISQVISSYAVDEIVRNRVISLSSRLLVYSRSTFNLDPPIHDN